MSDQSFIGLCNRMQGKSVTRGWDAIVTMNRTKINSLLEQQYIARFNKNSFLKKVSGQHPIDSAGYSVLELNGLLLSQPRLSFENATLANSRARLTFDVEAGTVNQRLDVPGWPSRVTSSFVVTPQQGYKVYADIELRATTGIVEKQGLVIIDLGEAVNFSSNLVDGDLAQEALGQFFHQLYASYPPEMRVYELGMLDFNDDDLLVPREFHIRTQMAPGGNDVSSDSYLDGAVVLFVRTRNNPTNGSLPANETEFDYYIPDDRHPDTGEAIYSGSLVLASRVVFDWYLDPFLMRNVGTNARFQAEVPSNDIGRSLRGVSGGLFLNDVEWDWRAEPNRYIVTNNVPVQVNLFAESAEQAFRAFSDSGRLQVKWNSEQSKSFNVAMHNPFSIPNWKYKDFDVLFQPALWFSYKLVVDSDDNIASFERLPDAPPRCTVDWSDLPGTLPDRFASDFQRDIDRPLNTMFEKLGELDFPAINFFHLNHLLFPEQNALLLSQAALPGDLFLVGHIDPKQTAFTLEPLFGRVKVGETLQFEVKQLALRAMDVTWSVRGIDGSRARGEISDDGKFTAPDVGLMDGLAVRNVITASYTDAETGEPREASALVVVVVEPMTLTPSMLTIDVEDASPVALKATVLKDEALTWTLRGPGTLNGTGYDVTYTPPATITESLLPIEIEVEGNESGNKVIATVVLLSGTFTLPVKPGFHPGLPAKTSIQLRLEDEDESDEPVWSVIAGEGSVDPRTGEYTAPDEIRSPYAVVQAIIGSGSRAHKGYSIVHLSDYARASRWNRLDFFRLTTDSLSTQVLSNGMQQVNVVVEVKPESNSDGTDVDISDEEWESIRLVTKNWAPLKQVGRDGVPPKPQNPDGSWDPWGYTNTRNEYQQYQGSQDQALIAGESRNSNGRTRTFYVQTRADTKLEIAAYLRGDNGLPYYSNENGGSVADKRLIEITPVAPPNFSTASFKMDVRRVKGQTDNDRYLDTIDYYYLSLEFTQPNTMVKFKTIDFQSATSIVQWESRQFNEDICSFTGYALERSSVLNFDPLLYARMPDVPEPEAGQVDKRVRPDKTVLKGHECPEGKFLISLHRCQYWNFDIGCEPDYASGLKLSIYDINGNKHAVKIDFRAATDRNLLVASKG